MRRRLRWIALTGALATAVVPAAQVASAAPVTPKAGPTLSVTLQLAPPNAPALRRLAQAEGLTAGNRQQQLTALTPSAATVSQVKSLALGEGLTVTGTTPFSVELSGPAGVVNAVFGHSLGADGTNQSLRVPATMTGLVTAAVGGDDTRPPWKRRFAPTEVTGSVARSVYNSQPGTPVAGSSQTIATLQFSGWDRTAFSRFATRVGKPNPLTNGIYSEISVDGANPATPDGGGGDGEVALDQESIYDTAPTARQRAYFAPNTFVSFVNAINRIAADATQPAPAPNLHITTLSISWGACEQFIAPATLTALNTAFTTLTAAGVTTFVSSGDFGPYDCSDPTPGAGGANTTPAVDYPAADPNVVAVGGTTLDATALNAPAEQTWWDPCTPAICGTEVGFAGFGGGAGVSTVFAKPGYQSAVLGGTPTGRIVPDISADANPESGFVVNVGPAGSPLQQFGGTSLAAPLSAAGFTNLLAGGGFNNGIGDIHSLLYSQAPARAFRDITVGVLGNGATQLSAAAGFDRATGWGSPQWGQLANLLYPPIPGNTYTAVAPCRVFDTRSAAGSDCAGAAPVTAGTVGPGATRTITIGGAVVPADATAVVLNVTGVNPTATTNVTVFPRGVTRPNTSNLNLVAGQPATPNLVTVKLGTNGQVDLFNAAGTINLIGDLAGYYTPTGDTRYTPVTPCRVFDTRPASTADCAGAPTVAKLKVGAGAVLPVDVGAVVPAGATAVVLNVTGVAPTAGTFVTVYPEGVTRPLSSNVNLAAGAKPRPNLVIVPVGAGGVVNFFNNRGTVDLIADLAGYFSAAPGGTTFRPITPCRAFDTRNGLGTCVGAVRVGSTPLGTSITRPVLMAGPNAVPDGAKALVLNVTAVGATADGFVTVFPDGVPLPGVSNINTAAGAGPTPNLVIVPVGANKRVSFFNRRGNVHLVVDILGYYL